MRIYFIQYEQIWSMSLLNAIDLARHALAGNEFNLDNYGKRIKAKYVNKPYQYMCLDFDCEDWLNTFKDLTHLALIKNKERVNK